MSTALHHVGCDFSCGDTHTQDQLAHCEACPVRDLAICASLEDDEIIHFAKFVAGHNVTTGTELFAEGDRAGNVYTLTEGVVKTQKLMPDGRRQITGFFFAGDFIGLAHGEDCAYSAEAVGPVKVCRFERQKFEAVLDDFPQTRKRLLHDASAELAVAHSQMVLLGRKTARERIATFLLMVDERTARWRANKAVLTLPMTRTDIADYLGLTTETVSRTFTQLRKDAVIESIGPQDVRLLSRDRLKEISEG